MRKIGIGGGGEKGIRRERAGGIRKQDKSTRNVHLVGYKVKDADPPLPVRSLVKTVNGRRTRGLGY